MELLKTKLNRANGLLAKIRHLVSKKLLRTIYFPIFDSRLRYGCQIWGQKDSQEFRSITTIQNKGLRIQSGIRVYHAEYLQRGSL